MKTSDIIAIFSIVVAIGAVVFAVISAWKFDGAKRLTRHMEDIDFKLKKLFSLIAADSQIIDIIAGALHSLNKRQTILYQLISLSTDDEFYANEEVIELAAIHKRLTELGLFSQDAVRRISAQRSLAHSDGDFQSLYLMKCIEQGKLGYRDPEIKEQILLLEKRLDRLRARQSVWAGRPGGGSF
ncbi:MAG: hypothetical protein WA268_00575 [Xanthobacteraceae bacterium]